MRDKKAISLMDYSWRRAAAAIGRVRPSTMLKDSVPRRPAGRRKSGLSLNLVSTPCQKEHFRWQRTYRYQKPIALAKDTRVDLEYTFDNSENNPRNPSRPPVRVKWGEQTTSEIISRRFAIVRLQNDTQYGWRHRRHRR